MKIKIAHVAFIILFSLQLQAQDTPFQKQDESGFFPGFKSNFRPQISIAPQVAYMSFSDLEAGGVGYGAEIALQCPLACPSKNYIRQQISFLTFSDDDYNYWTVSINPEYRLFVSPEFELAAGPSVGYFNSESNDSSSSGINYGISSSATLHFDSFILALSPRYILSKDITLIDTDFSQNHLQVILKLGYKF